MDILETVTAGEEIGGGTLWAYANIRLERVPVPPPSGETTNGFGTRATVFGGARGRLFPLVTHTAALHTVPLNTTRSHVFASLRDDQLTAPESRLLTSIHPWRSDEFSSVSNFDANGSVK